MIERITAEDSEKIQRRLANGLRKLGLRSGDRIALIAENCAETINLTLAALRSAIVPVLINPQLTESEQAALIDDADVNHVSRRGTTTSITSDEDDELSPYPLARPMHYTSGTTGKPKGVWSGILDESAASSLISEEQEQWNFNANDRHLVCSPLCHSAPIRFACGTLLAGGEVTILERFDAEAATRTIADQEITTTFMVPAHFQRLFSRNDLPSMASLRLVAHAGAPCPPRLKEIAIDRFPDGSLWEFYGSTEGQFSVCHAEEWLNRPGTVGQARKNRQLSVDEKGLIWCQVPTYARFEYWRNPEATKKAWRGNSFTVGDLGRIDDDGYLYLQGRRDDLIISGGVNVYPAEVEHVLGQLSGVESIVIFPATDQKWGQRVCAAVVGNVTTADLQSYAEVKLAPYKRPKEIHKVESLPYTGMGKMRRSRLASALGIEQEEMLSTP